MQGCTWRRSACICEALLPSNSCILQWIVQPLSPYNIFNRKVHRYCYGKGPTNLFQCPTNFNADQVIPLVLRQLKLLNIADTSATGTVQLVVSAQCLTGEPSTMSDYTTRHGQTKCKCKGNLKIVYLGKSTCMKTIKKYCIVIYIYMYIS